VLAIEPQNCRPATGQSSWAIHALELAVAVRCASVNAGRRAKGFSTGNVVCRRADSSCTSGFQVVAPSGHGEAARASGTTTASAPHSALRAWPPASRAARVAARDVLELLDSPCP
jgi:hypothetical protein